MLNGSVAACGAVACALICPYLRPARVPGGIMRALFGHVVRLQPVESFRDLLLMLALANLVFVSGCAQQPERISASEMPRPAPSPWALPTSTMRWNEYACEL